MKKRHLVLSLMLSFAVGGAGQAFDTIKMNKGVIAGRIVAADSTRVVLARGIGGAITKEVPVNRIQTIFYEAEPPVLRAAKNHALGGRYAEALAVLERIKQEPGRREMRQDIEFYKALCAAKLAIAGKMKIAEAGRMMKAFADANPKSYHYFEASEVVGDLLAAVGQYGQAAEYYARLDRAPWPDYKMRAGVAVGRTLLDQGKASEAAAVFDKVIATEVEGDLAQMQRTAACLGKARVLVALKEPGEAIKMVEEILKRADPKDVPLMARAYNVLGAAERQTGHIKEALLAFLHVDLLYSSVPDAHAEALANLVELWEQVHKTERANRARRTLQQRYKGG